MTRTNLWPAVLAVALTLACSAGPPPGDVGAPTATAATQATSLPSPLPLKLAARPTQPAITAEDLMTRLYILADDSMLGRQGGTLGNVKGTEYIAAEAKRIGLVPAGDGGGYFQTIPLVVRQPDTAGTLTVGGAPVDRAQYLHLPAAVLPFAPAFAATAVQTIFGGTAGDTARALTPEQFRGKVVVLAPPVVDGKPSFQFWTAPGLGRYAGAAAVAYATLDISPPGIRDIARRRQTGLDDGSPADRLLPAGLLVSDALVQRIFGKPAAQLQLGATGAALGGNLTSVRRPAEHPARNVVAVLPGSDPALRGQYVAIGAHNDHVGVGRPMPHDSIEAFNRVMRPTGAETQLQQPPTPEQWQRINALKDSLRALRPERIDSVFNGADDDGSGSVAMLEIAERLARGPRPKRSVLFVWHTGEELGLLGSRWYSDHATVPRDSIVTQLNIDMIGRGAGEGDAGVRGNVGVIGSSRLSSELGRIVAQEAQTRGLTLDMHFDAPGDTHQFYCRSDHYMYARFGIPIAFFFTGTHPGYHQITDEPQYINYANMARITEYIAGIATAVGNLDHRPVVDGKRQSDPNGPCEQ